MARGYTIVVTGSNQTLTGKHVELIAAIYQEAVEVSDFKLIIRNKLDEANLEWIDLEIIMH